jgi:hypothetical protein
MLRWKKRAPSTSLNAARMELRRAQEREKRVVTVVHKMSRTLDENHLAPKIRRAIRPPH